MNILIALLIFSLIVVIHELGHFLLAKKNGIGVTEFSVGMGPRIASFKKGETRYSLKLLPIGGSCMMLGEDELLDADNSFNKKSVWARISVIAAGPIFNFVLAFVLSLFVIGTIGYDPATVTRIDEGMGAQSAGLQTGDTITNIDGKNIEIGREIYNYFQFHKLTDAPIRITYVRDGEKATIEVAPQKTKTFLLGFSYDPTEQDAKILSITKDMPLEAAGLKANDIVTKVNETPIESGSDLGKYLQTQPLGETPISISYIRDNVESTVNVTPKFIEESYKPGFGYNLGRVKTSMLNTIKYSLVEVKYVIVSTIDGLGKMIGGQVKKDDIAGPVGIVGIIGDAYEQAAPEGILVVLLYLANISVLLSANLGVMNLLPIPALDGGRLLFLIIEVFRGKPIDQEKEGLVHLIGLVFLMVLMFFIMFNDISKLI